MYLILFKSAKPIKKHVGIRRAPDTIINNNTNATTNRNGNEDGNRRIQNGPRTHTPPQDQLQEIDLTIDYENHPLREAIHFKPLPPKIDPPEDASMLREEGEVIELEPNNDLTSPFRGVSLKDFEHHQKLLEEQNRQKVYVLQKAIEKQ